MLVGDRAGWQKLMGSSCLDLIMNSLGDLLGG